MKAWDALGVRRRSCGLHLDGCCESCDVCAVVGCFPFRTSDERYQGLENGRTLVVDVRVGWWDCRLDHKTPWRVCGVLEGTTRSYPFATHTLLPTPCYLSSTNTIPVPFRFHSGSILVPCRVCSVSIPCPFLAPHPRGHLEELAAGRRELHVGARAAHGERFEARSRVGRIKGRA